MDLTRRPRGRAVWTLAYLEVAAAEGHKFLTDEQYNHAVQQFEALAQEADPSHSHVVDVRAIEDFYELRDKGGVLGKINLRVYFTIERAPRLIVVLGVYKKEAEDQPPRHLVIRIRNRLRVVREQLRR